MTLSEENRFSTSATLFQYCREALILRSPQNHRVNDQDVGNLLDFDPADCTHWKYGRKNIRNISYIEQIAQKLSLDTTVIASILKGTMNLEDALGDIHLDDVELIADDKVRAECSELAQELLNAANIKSSPVYLPEILAVLPRINLREVLDETKIKAIVEGNEIAIIYSSNLELPLNRFMLAREIGWAYLLQKTKNINFVQAKNSEFWSVFALYLLMPQGELSKALSDFDFSHSFVELMSERFWVSSTSVKNRVKAFVADMKL